MKEIKAILVDDEEAARNVLERLLERSFPEITVVSKCSNLLEAVEQIKLLKPNVVFLDVQMPNYAGYEIGKLIDPIDFEIIFVTAYDQYAIKAFELSAIDYLVKPINRNRLNEAIERLKGRLSEKVAVENYEILLDSIKQKEHAKIVIPELGNKRILSLGKIIAVEANGAYSVIHHLTEKNILVSKNLKYFERMLPSEQFFRSHKSWIINLDHISSYSKGVGQIKLSKDIEAKLSKYRVGAFEAAN